MTKSFKVGATDNLADPLAFNALRFASKDEAQNYGEDLFARWIACKRFEVVESSDPVTHVFSALLGAQRIEDVSDIPTSDRQREGMRTLGHALADYRESKMR